MLPEVCLILESVSTTFDWTSKGGISTDRNWVTENRIELLFPTLKLKLKLTYSFDCLFDSQALALAGVLK